MPLFQKSVLNKYLKEQDKATVQHAYDKYRAYFHNPDIQQNIRESKEEQFQEGFLRELFVKVFGYVLNPLPDYNLTTEYKNERGAKKADGAVLKDGKAVAVIELKSTKTKDLESIRQQAFDYKANQAGCVYVLTSNFQKLRFYINDAVEFEEFDLFILSEERFEILFLCLNSENLLAGLPLKIKNASILEEEQITKKFYADYSLFKKDLFESMVNLNHEKVGMTKLLLYKKTQKLLDRFLFIFFAEDRGLLPPNSISRMIKRWNVLKDEDAYKPLYEIYKQYFGYLNKGRKGKVPADDIHEYNGGLFLPDKVLDEIKIDDDVLLRHTSTLTNYDFDSSVDVNILGHIFEHSLNEIESTTAELEGVDFDKQKTKRKKDGVYYTPKYITKYIVDNTVGKLCEEKKTKLGFNENEFTPKRRKETKRKLLANLEKYRSWLLELTICDPACGSGAFLNQALEFLINEHHYIDELNARLFGSTMVFQDVENRILENNLFGVDINEESVDIARLSLWLRTAQRGRKLTTLNKNIKCGNSLIDDPKVAGEKAFDWYKEFPQVFRKKEKKAWHITTATHNSRYSQRMYNYHVKSGEPVWLSEREELIVTETIADISEEDNLNILAYNVCGDHIHLILVCEEEEVPKITGKLKSVSARECNMKMGRTIPDTGTAGHAPLYQDRGDTQTHLWALRFGSREIKNQKQLSNTINYIKGNRQKHELPENENLKALIEKMTCTLKHAFRTEYKGGFDVVIGNPPYVQIYNNQNYYSKEYDTSASGDLYALFYERGVKLLRENGYFSYISPSLFIKGLRYGTLRNFLLNNTEIIEIADKGDGVFQDVQMPTAIVVAKKKKVYTQEWNSFIPGGEITSKMENHTVPLSTISRIKRGLEIGKDKVTSYSSGSVKIITGEDVERYGIKNYHGISELVYNEFKKDEEFFCSERIIIRETGNRITALYVNEDVQQNRSLYSILLEKEISYKFILGIINSTLIQFYYKSKFAANTDIFPKIRIAQVKSLPIKLANKSIQEKLDQFVYDIANLKSELLNITNQFINLLQAKFNIPAPGKKLQNWHELVFGEFLNELEKARKRATRRASGISEEKANEAKGHAPLPHLPHLQTLQPYAPLTLQEQAEWMEYFNGQKQKAMELKAQIDRTEKKIDWMVYDLYGLNEEERKTVEGS